VIENGVARSLTVKMMSPLVWRLGVSVDPVVRPSLPRSQRPSDSAPAAQIGQTAPVDSRSERRVHVTVGPMGAIIHAH